ncbi:MAG: hypothetical protein ACE15E_01885 [Acidobacteriota bacterium]
MKTRLPAFSGLSRRSFCGLVWILTVSPLFLPAVFSEDPPSRRFLTLAEKEAFLRNAKVIRSQAAKKGITGSVRATLSDGTLTNDASIQRIDFYRSTYNTPAGLQIGFRDSYKFNIAAYRLAVLLGIDNVPPSVERSYDGTKGAYTWWIEDVVMDEGERLKRKISPPDARCWNEQMHLVRVFDQLIDNIDRNVQNLLITKDWKIWMIDHTRAFRPGTELRKPSELQKCDRKLLDRLRVLTSEQLKAELGDYLTKSEIKGLLARRDLLVRHFEALGEACLYNLRRDVPAHAATR